uniref:Toll/interleukin-1 receptor-like protein n=1 Tax=Rhizophora mucronata TaxID=61149 RepID=A0A2P2LWI9_RHIMU
MQWITPREFEPETSMLISSSKKVWGIP